MRLILNVRVTLHIVIVNGLTRILIVRILRLERMLIRRPQLCKLVLIRTSGESRLSRRPIAEP